MQLMYGGMDLHRGAGTRQAGVPGRPVRGRRRVRILLATDTASEGIDLQNHCSKLIHVEIPWNPNVMEQRNNGRIDKYGQQRNEVDILHFVPAGYDHEAADPKPILVTWPATSRFLFRAVKKVDQIREDLGKVGPVIADQVEKKPSSEETVAPRHPTCRRGRAARQEDPEARTGLAGLHRRPPEPPPVDPARTRPQPWRPSPTSCTSAWRSPSNHR